MGRPLPMTIRAFPYSTGVAITPGGVSLSVAAMNFPAYADSG